MKAKVILIVLGIFLLMAASVFFIRSAEVWEEEKNRSVDFYISGGILSLLSLFCVSVLGYLYGTGEPRFSSEMKINQIYEIVGKVPAGENKVITVIRKQNGKIRVFRFNQHQVPNTKFIKVTKNDKGGKEFPSFPP